LNRCAKHAFFSSPAQHLLHLAHTMHAVRGDPPERHAGGDGAADHLHGKPGLGRERHTIRHCGGHMARGQARGVVGPTLGQMECVVDEGMAVTRGIGREHADLAVGNFALPSTLAMEIPSSFWAVLHHATTASCETTTTSSHTGTATGTDRPRNHGS